MTGAEPEASPISGGTRGVEMGLRWACVIMAFAASLPALRMLGYIWKNSEYLGHGYLIPVASAVLVYSRREAIGSALRTGPVPASGPLWVLLAALFETAAVAGEVVTAAGVGIPLLLAATAYALGGGPLLRAAGLPIGFLLLMVPPPHLVEDRILIGLKSVVTQTSVGLLQWAGYSVAASGNRILVPGHELFVANACSGLTSIITLLPLGVVVAYFLSHGVWRRAAIVVSIVPLAMLGNIVRVVGTVTIVASRGIEFAQGLLHETFGLTTFVAGTVVLVTLAKVLR